MRRALSSLALLFAACSSSPSIPGDLATPPDLAQRYDFAHPGGGDGGAVDLAMPPADLSASRSDGSGGSDGGAGAADLEINYCIVQFPASANATVGQPSPLIYGQVYQQGLTDASNTPAQGIGAQLGFGPSGSDPRGNAAWTWIDAVPNPGYDFSKNNDEYQASITAPKPMAYSYVYRFTVTAGQGYTYCDTVGNGGNNGLPLFDPAKAGTLNVK